MELKYLDQLRKNRSVSHSPIDNRGLFIRQQEYKSQVTSYKYRLV